MALRKKQTKFQMKTNNKKQKQDIQSVISSGSGSAAKRFQAIKIILKSNCFRIDPEKLNREFAKLSRRHLRVNGIPTKGLSSENCIALANQHMRAFLGMDKPNIFTGVK